MSKGKGKGYYETSKGKGKGYVAPSKGKGTDVVVSIVPNYLSNSIKDLMKLFFCVYILTD